MRPLSMRLPQGLANPPAAIKINQYNRAIFIEHDINRVDIVVHQTQLVKVLDALTVLTSTTPSLVEGKSPLFKDWAIYFSSNVVRYRFKHRPMT